MVESPTLTPSMHLLDGIAATYDGEMVVPNGSTGPGAVTLLVDISGILVGRRSEMRVLSALTMAGSGA